MYNTINWKQYEREQLTTTTDLVHAETDYDGDEKCFQALHHPLIRLWCNSTTLGQTLNSVS